MTSPASNQEQPLPPELAKIQAEAAAVAPPVIDPNAPAAALAAAVDYLGDAADLTSMIFEGGASFYPSTAPVLQPKQARFAAALGKVMEKRQWSLAALLGKWGAEIELAFVASALALPLTKAIKADRAAAALEKAKAETAAKPADPQPERPAADPYNAAFQGATAAP